MRFRKSVVPLGSSVVCSARAAGERADFFMSSSGVIVKKTFDFVAHTLATAKDAVAYVDGYLALEKGAVLDLGEIVYEKYN